LHTELLMAIANALEAVLVRRQAPDAVMQEWDRVEAEIHRAARRRFWRNVILLCFFFGAIALLVIVIAVFAK
jgi:type VI protein secretion system component VasF